MFIKVLAVFGFLAVASAADLTVGGKGGKIIFEQNVTASPAIWKQTENVTVNVTNSDEVISRVVVIDNRPEKDGEAEVVDGGEGHKNVTIELQSPAIFRGFDFSIQVFAAPEKAHSSAPGHPKSTGLDTQNPQVLNVKDTQKPKHEQGKDIVLGAPATATTEAAKPQNDDQGKIKIPAAAGNEQTRLNRDTESQKTSEQTTIGTTTDLPSGSVIPAKDLHEAINAIFANNFSANSVGEDQAQAVIPLSNDEEQQKEDEKESLVPALNKQSNEHENQTTLKNELSSTTQKINEPKVVPVTAESSSTTSADKSTTEATNVKTTHLEHNLKGHAWQHHNVPLPYVNH